MAELVDALASGASGGNPVEVQVLLSAPSFFSQKFFPFRHWLEGAFMPKIGI